MYCVSVCFILFPLTLGICMLFLCDFTSQGCSALDVMHFKIHEKHAVMAVLDKIFCADAVCL